MDAKDLEILLILLLDGRKSYEKIAKNRRVNLSPNTVKKRIDNMVKLGVIKRFSTQLNPQLVNYNACFTLATIKEDILQKSELVEKIGELKEVVGGVVFVENKIQFVHLFRDATEMHQTIEKIKGFSEIESIKSYILLFPPMDGLSKTRITRNDWRIIRALRPNCRKTDIELADELKLSAKTIKRRVNYLKNNGIILFMIDLDTSSADLLTYTLILTLQKISSEKLIRIKAILKNIFYTWRVANQETLILTVVINHLREIEDQIKEIREIMPDVVEIEPLTPTKTFYFRSWIDDFIEEKSRE